MDATLEEVVKLAEQLNPEQQNLLIYRLRVKQMEEQTSPETPQPAPSRHSPMRADLIRDTEKLRKTEIRPGSSLLGKYAYPDAPEVSEEEFHAQMHAIATEWEQELDEFHDDEP
jgi:hypothetical protein